MVFVLLLLLDGASTFKGLQCPFHIVFIHKLFGYLDGLVGQELFIVELLNWLVWEDLREGGLFYVSQILFIIYVIYSLLYFFILLVLVPSNILRLILMAFNSRWLPILSPLKSLFGLNGLQRSSK